MDTVNKVTLFSNGIGHFCRYYTVNPGKSTTISIPFKRDHIGDVASSLQVFGPVRLESPPSFTPSNANATALRIDQNKALESLLTNLSGATLRLTLSGSKTVRATEYTLLGIDRGEITRNTSNGNTRQLGGLYVILMNNGSITRYPIENLSEIEFVEESVRTEIEKALKNNFQMIKPDSTLMELTLTSLGNEVTQASIQYAIPVAAWKMRYSIREDHGKFHLEGSAIIDNNTDEVWDDFQVSVVTGNPISFATDIANIVVPQRKMVPLVDGVVQGNVQAREINCDPDSVLVGSAKPEVYAASVKHSVSNYASFGLTRTDNLDIEAEALEQMAESPGVESKEVGDFCIFTSKLPVTVLARKSAIIPMFSVPLSKAGLVLHYNMANNPRRPYRAIKFKNETEYSLGKGKTTIYNDGVFSGECVLETTKPGESRMLPHCLENGVKVNREVSPVERYCSSIRIAQGIMYDEQVQISTTKYTIKNYKNEAFKMALEHLNVLGIGMMYHDEKSSVKVEFGGIEIRDKEPLSDNKGWRAYLELPPNGEVVLTAKETFVVATSERISRNYYLVQQRIVEGGHQLAENESIRACVEIQEKIQDLNDELSDLQSKREDLTKRADRVRQNVTAAKDAGVMATVGQWVNDLDKIEKEIHSLDSDYIPQKRQEIQNFQETMRKNLDQLVVSWKLN